MSTMKVLVIGGSTGIGEGIAASSLALGADVVVASHTADKLSTVKEKFGSAVLTELVDVADEAQVKALFDRVGEVDHVVFCAEAVMRGPFRKVTTSTERQNFEVKFWGAYYTAFHMRIKAGGSFTLFSGSISRMPWSGMTNVSMINSALETMARGLAFELAPIRVNCISPGTIDTPAWLHISAADREALFAKTRAELPVRRVGAARDAVDAAMMVMQNGFITGSVIDVDGGALLVGYSADTPPLTQAAATPPLASPTATPPAATPLAV
jgi:NAD(P)-dependent dehydrogenase (short-subunit alcohol dehydrogenase family)